MSEMIIAAMHEGEARTNTLVIAEGTANDHASVIKLVRTYLSDLEEFGLVGFEIRPRQIGQHGGGDTEYALLNEQQATLIMTYMRNSEIVRNFKKRLVKEFYRLAHSANTTAPLTLEMQMAQGLLAAQRLIEQKDVAIAERDKMIAIVAPKAAALDRIANTDGLTCISTAAKVLKKGQKELFQWLFKNKWIFKRHGGKHWLAHQDKLRLGYLEHKLYTYKGSDGEEKTETQAYITVKGITKLASIFGTAQCELEVAA